MGNFMNKLAAEVTTRFFSLREKAKGENGDIVQTLIVIGIAVALGVLIWGPLSGMITNCLNNLENGQACFGSTGA